MKFKITIIICLGSNTYVYEVKTKLNIRESTGIKVNVVGLRAMVIYWEWICLTVYSFMFDMQSSQL